MKIRLCRMVCLILLTQLFLLPLTVPEAKADTRITITFAAGGVACGVYFFLQFAFQASLAMQQYQYQNDTTALFNHDHAGWQIKYPSLNLIRDGHLKMSCPKDTPDAAQIEILKLRF